MAYFFERELLSLETMTSDVVCMTIEPILISAVDKSQISDSTYWFIASRPQNLFKLINLLLQLIFLSVYHLTSIFHYKTSTFFVLSAVFAWEILIRSLVFQITQLLSLLILSIVQSKFIIDTSSNLDVFGDFFRHPVIFLMAANRLAEIKYSIRFDMDKVFSRSEDRIQVTKYANLWPFLHAILETLAANVIMTYTPEYAHFASSRLTDKALAQLISFLISPMALLFTDSDLNGTRYTPPSGYIAMSFETIDQVDQSNHIAATADGYWIIVSRPENLSKILNLIVQLAYLAIYHLTTVFYYKRSAFFALTALFSWEIALRTLYFLSVQVLSLIVPIWLYGVLTETSMVFDVFGHFFRHPMVFLMAAHRLILVKFSMRVSVSRWMGRSRIIILVSLCVLFAAIAAVILIQTSEMRRLYIRSIGFVDSGVPGYQMLINRIFYIFPFGSIICYVILYFHIRRMTQQVMSRRTAASGEQRVFIQLFITILFYGAMCAVFEYINTRDWSSSPADKINLVAVLNIVNYLPEISLPLMLLISNTDMRRRISTIVGPRVTKSATVSVVPMQG